MADNYKEYLAARVVADSKPVTYRLLSRALKVNVNVAKQMLYEFHSKQNAKKPNSVHATYLLTGRKPPQQHTNGVNGSGKDGDDTVMQSSPFMSSLPEPEEPAEEPIQRTSIVLVREEDLEATKAEFELITSIHIYSLEPGPIENLNLLSVCNHEIATAQAGDDPLERWRLYGSIHNPYIKRRTARYTPAAAPTAPKTAPKVAAKPSVTAPSKENAAASEDKTSSRPASQTATTTSMLKKSDSKSNLKREKSDLFKSFAKTKPPKPKEEKSKDSTPAPAEDETMQGMSEDEGDADDTPDIKFDEEKAAEVKRARAEREEKLRKMMEESDDEMADAPAEEENDSQDIPPPKEPSPEPGSEAAVTSQGGRRRGRRKVMKKIRAKDADGYMVTKEEAVWESFSEDEPELKKPRPAPKPSTAKPKAAGKKGQGSIASFFKKA